MASGVAASTGRFGSVAIISAIVVAVLGGLLFKVLCSSRKLN